MSTTPSVVEHVFDRGRDVPLEYRLGRCPKCSRLFAWLKVRNAEVACHRCEVTLTGTTRQSRASFTVLTPEAFREAHRIGLMLRAADCATWAANNRATLAEVLEHERAGNIDRNDGAQFGPHRVAIIRRRNDDGTPCSWSAFPSPERCDALIAKWEREAARCRRKADRL